MDALKFYLHTVEANSQIKLYLILEGLRSILSRIKFVQGLKKKEAASCDVCGFFLLVFKALSFYGSLTKSASVTDSLVVLTIDDWLNL